MYIDHGGYQSICLVIPGAEIKFHDMVVAILLIKLVL